MALLSGRMEVIHVDVDTSVRQLKLEAGQALQVSIASLSRSDGSQLEELLTIREAQLVDSEVLQATMAKVRVEMEGKALRLLEQLDSPEPARIEDAVYQVGYLEVEGPEELSHLFQLILSKALSTPPAAAACTDMMCGLRERYPSFDGDEEEQALRISSTRLLLNLVQHNYEKLFSDDPNDQGRQKRKLDLGRFRSILARFRSILERFTLILRCFSALRRLSEPFSLLGTGGPAGCRSSATCSCGASWPRRWWAKWCTR